MKELEEGGFISGERSRLQRVRGFCEKVWGGIERRDRKKKGKGEA